MKRLLAIVLAVVILFSASTLADEQTVDQKANEIFDSLVHIYDGLLFYLEQRQTTWTALLTANPKEADFQWFMDNMYVYDDVERATAIIAFGMKNETKQDQFSNSDSLYRELFLPLYKSYGETDDGLMKACFAFTMMVFYDETLEKQLESQKIAIKALMTEAPDYAYLSNLQDFYKKTSQLMDYVSDSSDNYAMAAQSISEFEKTKREIKSDFDFVFDWPEYYYVPREMPIWIKEIFDKYAAQEAAKQKAEEEKQKAEEERATGKEPSEILSTLIPEGLSFGNTREECEAVITKSGRKNYFGKTMIVLYEEPISSYTAKTVRLYFSGEGATDKLIRVGYSIYGGDKEAEAAKEYKKVLPNVIDICGNPQTTRSDRERPEYNDLKGDLVGSLTTGSAYKSSDFDGIINDFAEWLKEDGGNRFAVILFNKLYKAHKHNQVELYIESVQ